MSKIHKGHMIRSWWVTGGVSSGADQQLSSLTIKISILVILQRESWHDFTGIHFGLCVHFSPEWNLNIYLTDWHKLYRHSWLPEDVSLWVWCCGLWLNTSKTNDLRLSWTLCLGLIINHNFIDLIPFTIQSASQSWTNDKQENKTPKSISDNVHKTVVKEKDI